MTDAKKKNQDFLNSTKGLREESPVDMTTASSFIPQEKFITDPKTKTSFPIFQNQPKDITKSFKPAPTAEKPQEIGKLGKPAKAKGGRNYVPNGRGRGGDKGGRKPMKAETIIAKGVQAYLDEHFIGQVDMQITGKDGKTVTIKKPRSIILIEALFNKGARDQDVSAIDKWFDRALGKASQPIRGDENNDTPIRLEHDVSKILDKAYDDDED